MKAIFSTAVCCAIANHPFWGGCQRWRWHCHSCCQHQCCGQVNMKNLTFSLDLELDLKLDFKLELDLTLTSLSLEPNLDLNLKLDLELDLELNLKLVSTAVLVQSLLCRQTLHFYEGDTYHNTPCK